MAQTIASLLIKIGVSVSEVNKGFKQVEGNMKGLKGKLQKNGAKIAAVFGIIGAGVTKGLKSAVKASNEFELDLAKLNNIAHLTVSELDKVGKESQTLASRFGVSSNEIVHGLSELGKLGYSTAESLKAMPEILKFTVASGSDFDTTIGLLETTMNDFGLSLEDTAHNADIFTAAMGKANNLTGKDLAAAFTKAGASANDANASVSDLSAAVVLLAKKGFTGASAGTALNAIFGNLAKSGGTAQKKLQELGISVVDSSGKMKPFGQIVTEVQKKFKGLTGAQRLQAAQAIAGKEHMSKFLGIVKGAPGSFEALSASLDKSGGATNKAFAGIDKTAAQSLEKLKASFGNFEQNIGKALAPAIQTVTDALTKLFDWFNKLSPETQEIIAYIGVAVAVFSVLAAVVGAVALAFTLLSLPILAIIAAIALVVAAFLWYWKNSEKVNAAVKKGWEAVKAWFASIPAWFAKIWKSVLDSASKTWDNIKKKVSDAWNAIKTKISNTWNEIKAIFQRMTRDALTWGINLIKGFARGIAAGVTWVTNAARKVAAAAKRFLGIHSPSEAGPLSDSDKWMPNLMNMLTKGIEMGIPKLQMAVGDVAATIASGEVAASTGNVKTVNNNVNVYPRQARLDARGLNRELERMRFLNGGMF